jgi:glutamate-5-semialdehyde dehydrogenase
MKLLVGGQYLYSVTPELAASFRPGDVLRYVEATSEVVHIPRAQQHLATEAVSRAFAAFEQMGQIRADQIATFYEAFAARLADEVIWANVATANATDVAAAKARGRSTTRLEVSDKMRRDMIAGLRGWITTTSRRGQILETIEHDGWKAELIGAELGVVAFIFEGRPNVLADATGVLRSGNTVVLRIGRDALGTARSVMEQALRPALKFANMPEDTVVLVDSPEHAAGWALFTDRRLSLAVARGSGPAVATLGSLAQSAGVPVSLHGTGGAWILTGESCTREMLKEAIVKSLDRKVCNTVNTCCILRSKSAELVPAFLQGLEDAGKKRGQAFKLHVVKGDESSLPQAVRDSKVSVRRAHGNTEEPQVELLGVDALGQEWEWEDTPEVSFKLIDDIAEGIALYNQYSPRFVVSVLTTDEEERQRSFLALNAPFFGDGFTRWVDGQYALKRPELGLSNWENGRLLGRSGILSGDSVYTVRVRVSGHGRGIPKDR